MASSWEVSQYVSGQVKLGLLPGAQGTQRLPRVAPLPTVRSAQPDWTAKNDGFAEKKGGTKTWENTNISTRS